MSPAKTTKKTAKKATKAPAKKAAAKKTTKAPAKKVARKAVAKTPAKKTTAKTAAKKVATKKPAAKKKTTKKKVQVITASERHSMIAEAAYFAAESFGFGGDSHGHWLYAEAQIDAGLAKGGIQVSA